MTARIGRLLSRLVRRGFGGGWCWRIGVRGGVFLRSGSVSNGARAVVGNNGVGCFWTAASPNGRSLGWVSLHRRGLGKGEIMAFGGRDGGTSSCRYVSQYRVFLKAGVQDPFRYTRNRCQFHKTESEFSVHACRGRPVSPHGGVEAGGTPDPGVQQGQRWSKKRC